MSPVVLITGATGGIGRAVALAYADQGASLVLTARSEGLLADLVAACERRGALALALTVDVVDSQVVRSAFAEAIAQFGRVDIVVHTAATVAYGRLSEVPERTWNAVVDTGVHGTANVAREALATFEAAGRGNLVVIGSVLGQITAPLMGSYVTSKWAVHGLVRVLQQEARQTPGVRVSLVAPGGIDTRIYTLAATYIGRSGKPPPPVLSPEAVARTVVRVVARNRKYADVGPANPVMRLGFAVVPFVFDALVGPLFSLLALAHDDREPSEGNVFLSSEEAEDARTVE